MTNTIPAWEEIDALVDEDPLKLRDVAWDLARRLEQMGAGVDRAVVLLRRQVEVSGHGLAPLRCLEQATGAPMQVFGEAR